MFVGLHPFIVWALDFCHIWLHRACLWLTKKAKGVLQPQCAELRRHVLLKLFCLLCSAAMQSLSLRRKLLFRFKKRGWRVTVQVSSADEAAGGTVRQNDKTVHVEQREALVKAQRPSLFPNARAGIRTVQNMEAVAYLSCTEQEHL